MSAFICGFEVAGSICIHDEWHDGGHVMVPASEVDRLLAKHPSQLVEAA